MRPAPLLLATALLLAVAGAAAGADDDEREGYYYPPVTSEEEFNRTLAPAPPSDRAVRIAFVTEITRSQFESPTEPRIAIFAKGDDADHMIITALDAEIFRTLFRARAVLAQMTAGARQTEFFTRAGISTSATWFDLAKMLGFTDIVLTDGETWAHRVTLK